MAKEAKGVMLKTLRHGTDRGYGKSRGSKHRAGSKSKNPGVYNSFNKFKISSYMRGSPQWQKALTQYLLDMKNHGHNIRTVQTDKVRIAQK